MTREREPSLDEARAALDLLRTTPLGMPTPQEIENERARLVPWLENAVADLPARRRARARRRAMIGGASFVALAAGVALAFSLGLPRGSEPNETALETPGARVPNVTTEPAATLLEGSVESGDLVVLPGSRLGLSSRLRTSSALGAALEGEGGLRVALGPETAMRFRDRAHIELDEGSVELAVPKLAAGSTLEVSTGDTIVRVRGTRFVVRRVPGSPRTCVEVSEGLVEVEFAGTTTNLRAGERVGCAAPSDAGRAPEPEAPRASTAAPRASTTLAEENRLLTRALAAERAGDRARARASFRELLDRFPDSHFLPEARAGLARVDPGTP